MSEASYPLRWRGRQTEPLSLAEIQRRLERREIGMWHEIQANGRWMTLDEFYVLLAAQGTASPAPRTTDSPPGLLRLAGADASNAGPAGGGRLDALPVPPPVAAESQPGRPRWTYVLLALATGMVGLHSFFAGYWRRGIAQAALCVATCWLGYGVVATWLWAVGEAIWIRRDARGFPLR